MNSVLQYALDVTADYADAWLVWTLDIVAGMADR